MSLHDRPWQRSLLIGLGLALVLLIIGMIGFLTGDGSAPGATEPDRVSLIVVPGGVAATSARHGPYAVTDGRATGFSHDALGAAMAASNIAPRITVAAGLQVYEPTLAEQCWGDVQATSEQLALPRPDEPNRQDLDARALYYRVLAGDPGGEHLVVSLLADTPQSRGQGGWSRVDLTLRWSGTDWQLRVPTPRPSLHRSTTDYALLGPTP